MVTDTSTGTSLESDDTSTDSTTEDSTAQNTAVNDPVKNKKLATVTMMEPLRSLLNFTVTIPGTFKGLHTNQFCWLEVGDDFYDTFYGDIAGTIGDTKFARYAGFKKGRFYIEEVKTRFDLNEGITTELTLNPFASMYSEYIKMQLNAEQALQEALQAKSGSTSTSNNIANVNGTDCESTNKYHSNKIGTAKSLDIHCTKANFVIIGNSSANYAEAAKQGSLKAICDFMDKKALYSCYADNAKFENGCPQKIYAMSPIRGNCADFARLMKCIFDVAGYKSVIVHIPGHFYNAVWENGKWVCCDLCTTPSYNNVNLGRPHRVPAETPDEVGA